MSDGLDIDALLERFRERAEAVKRRNLPPVGGDERAAFVKQAQTDYMDYAMIGDADGDWQVALLGKNLTDEETTTWGNDVPLGQFGFYDTYFQIIDAPRSFELQVRYIFR